VKVVLTGASSFTGLWFASALAEAGHEVVAPIRQALSNYAGPRQTRLALLAKRGVRLVEGMSFGDEAFRKLLSQGLDVLCHHGAEVSDYRSPDFDVLAAVHSNTLEARATLAAARAAGCRALVVTGSVFEADEGVGDLPLRAFLPYGLSKGLSWQVLRYRAQEAGLSACKFLIPNPFGPHEEPRFCTYLVRQWQAGQVAQVATPRYVRDNIHVSLLALAYRQFVEQAGQGRADLHVAPSGYVESQGAFAQRFAHEIGTRLGLEARLELREQVAFSEPLVRINTDRVRLAEGLWSEAQAWDQLARFYEQASGQTAP
jgi:UDP-glucose 4-epimerase